jgi:hypothetical protein
MPDVAPVTSARCPSRLLSLLCVIADIGVPSFA